MSDQDSAAPAAVEGPEAAADPSGPGQDQSSLPALIMALVALLVSVDIAPVQGPLKAGRSTLPGMRNPGAALQCARVRPALALRWQRGAAR